MVDGQWREVSCFSLSSSNSSSNQAHSTVCSPLFPFFSVPLFLYSSILSRISLWTCLCQWLHQILGYATLQKYRNKFDKQIVENLKKDFIHSKREYFIILISDLCLKEPLNLLRKRGPKYNTLTLSTEWWMLKWQNGRISCNAKCLLVWSKSVTWKMELQWNKKTIYN